MAKSPGRAALDEALQHTLTSGLKARGFRKRGLNWSYQDEERELRIEIEPSRRQVPGDGAWRATISWVLPVSPASSHRCAGSTSLASLTSGIGYDWRYLNPNNYTDEGLLARADLPTAVATSWQQHIAPMIDAATDLTSLVTFLLPTTPTVLSAGKLVGYALECGDEELVVATLERLALTLKSDEVTRGTEWTPENRFEGFWGFYERIEDVQLNPRAQELLRSLLDGLDRPEHPMAQHWFDPIAVAAGLT
ncbi:MAG: hypothetical protein GY701_25640 [Sulfitobacter sp.]|nr:hypothetical protein [Sulfitobacter sp.]MCP4085506.1 hypothetical protein [Actinomycetes bacterium]